MEAVGCEHGHALSVQIPHCGGVCCLHSGHGVPSWCRDPSPGRGVPSRCRVPPRHGVPSRHEVPYGHRVFPLLCEGSPLGAGSPLLGAGSPVRAGSPPGHRVPLWVLGPPFWARCPPLGARPPFWAQGHSGVQTPLLVTVPPRNTCAVSPADPPRDPLLTAFLETQRGRLAIFQASVASNPPAELALHHGERLVASSSGGGLSPSPRVSAAAAPNSLRVEVREVTLGDEGSYRLTATNAFGTAVQRLFLHVQGERREGPWGWDGAPAASPGRGAEPHIRGRPVPSRAPRPLLAMGRAPK